VWRGGREEGKENENNQKGECEPAQGKPVMEGLGMIRQGAVLASAAYSTGESTVAAMQ